MGPGTTGKAGLSRIATRALGRLTRHDAARDRRRSPPASAREARVVAALAGVLLLGWVVWTQLM